MRKRAKDTRQRGTHTHGWGSKKKHRGAGNRGGRGNAGSGKRGDAKKPSYWKDRSYYKSKGFVSIHKPLKSINIKDLRRFKDTKIDLKKEGFDKLLSLGDADRKYDITVFQASESAIKKIEEKGGKVTLLKAEVDKKEAGSSEVKKEESKAEAKDSDE